MTLAQDMGRGNVASRQSRVRLYELGPRMELEIIKVCVLFFEGGGRSGFRVKYHEGSGGGGRWPEGLPFPSLFSDYTAVTRPLSRALPVTVILNPTPYPLPSLQVEEGLCDAPVASSSYAQP